MKKTIILSKPRLFSFAECLWFLDRGLDDVMHKVRGDSVFKLFESEGAPVLLQIRESKSHLEAQILIGTLNKKDESTIKDFITEWFDLDRTITAFYKRLDDDADLKILKKSYHGLRIIGIPNFFELLCWCVIGQQINLNFAYKVKRRFVELYGTSLMYEQEKFFLFPSPEIVSALTVDELKKLQLTTRKAEYIIGIAKLFVSGELSKQKIKLLDNEQKMLEELVKIRGIGEWTANYTIMKGFRAMNGVPYGDSGVNQALFNLKGIPKKNNRMEVDKVFDKFKGWKTYLVFYLWRSLRNPL